MKQIDKKAAAKNLETLSTRVVSKKIIPLITKSGILVGSYIVRPANHRFEVRKSNETLYTTFSKTAALIVAQMLASNSNREVNPILEYDRKVASAREDLEVFKYHYNKAEQCNNDVKKSIMMSKFEAANDRYQLAKKHLQESYYRLF